jgi:cell division protein FtsX
VRTWIERQRHIVDFTLSSLLRRKGKNVALLLVYTLVVFMLASVIFCTRALREEAGLLLAGAPEVVVQRNVAGRHDLIPLSYREKIAGIRGVREVRERLWGYYYDPATKANYTFLVATDPPVREGTAAIGNGISRTRKAYPGDLMSFRSASGKTMLLAVERTLSSESELVSADLVLVSERDFRELFGVPAGVATDLALTVRNPREVLTVARKVAELLPDTRPILREEILRTYDAVFGWRSGILIVILSATALSFVILAWDKASGLSAEERREIGILKAIGWETSDVIVMKFWEGTIVSLTAFLAGVLLAYAHVFLGKSALIIPVLKGWSILYPDFRLTPHLDPDQLVVLFFLTVIPYTVATVVPSWRAATVDPDAVMREAV